MRLPWKVQVFIKFRKEFCLPKWTWLRAQPSNSVIGECQKTIVWASTLDCHQDHQENRELKCFFKDFPGTYLICLCWLITSMMITNTGKSQNNSGGGDRKNITGLTRSTPIYVHDMQNRPDIAPFAMAGFFSVLHACCLCSRATLRVCFSTYSGCEHISTTPKV